MREALEYMCLQKKNIAKKKKKEERGKESEPLFVIPADVKQQQGNNEFISVLTGKKIDMSQEQMDLIKKHVLKYCQGKNIFEVKVDDIPNCILEFEEEFDDSSLSNEEMIDCYGAILLSIHCLLYTSDAADDP